VEIRARACDAGRVALLWLLAAALLFALWLIALNVWGLGATPHLFLLLALAAAGAWAFRRRPPR
jgi:hypothetical protein